jgi:hypothetical protein
MRYCVIPEGQKANCGWLARTGVSSSLVVETLHFADRSIANLADCFLRTKPRRLLDPLADQAVPEDATCSFRWIKGTGSLSLKSTRKSSVCHRSSAFHAHTDHNEHRIALLRAALGIAPPGAMGNAVCFA